MTDVRLLEVRADYGAGPVLDDLSLEVASGELVAVLGASGSGKTTLLRVLAGFMRPSAGRVEFGDRLVAGPGAWVPPERRRVGIVPQEGALFPHLDVRGNVAFGLGRRPRDSGRVDEVLDLVGMSAFREARPQELSGGQQQRVALARALAPEPDVILLDEPFSALDAALRVRLRGDVREVLDRLGTTTVLVTHDQEEALSMADRVAVVRGGRIVQCGAPEQLYLDPVDLETARFVGDVVELPAVVVGDGLVDCVLGRVTVRPAPALGVAGILAMRPEQLALVEKDAASPDPLHGAPGWIRARSYHGHDTLVIVELDAGVEVAVRVRGRRAWHPPDRVGVVVRGTGRLFTPA